ncbi:MAG: hypothetical protein AAFW00_19900 [Bacteroidota bacterium]
MIVPENMLCFIFSRKKLLIGMNPPESQPRLLTFDDKLHLPYEGRAIPEVIDKHWEGILNAYRQELDTPMEQIPVSMVYPSEAQPGLKQGVIDTIKGKLGDRVQMVHAENLALAYLHGMVERKELVNSYNLVIEALDDVVNVWMVKLGDVDDEVEGKEALFATEHTHSDILRGIGPNTGMEHILREAMKQFESAGLSLNMRGQTDLAHQILSPSSDYIFTVSQESDHVQLEGQLSFSKERFTELMASNKEKLKEVIGAGAIARKNIKRVLLIGKYLQNPVLQEYMDKQLAIGKILTQVQPYDERNEYEAILRGALTRMDLIRQAEDNKAKAEERKREEAAKRAQIQAELQKKDARESLFEEMQQACVNPADQEKYEELFVKKGEQLGIPEVVIKWNISEIISKISLEQEVAVIDENNAPQEEMSTPEPEPEVVAEAPVVEMNKSVSPPPVKVDKPESKPAPEPVKEEPLASEAEVNEEKPVPKAKPVVQTAPTPKEEVKATEVVPVTAQSNGKAEAKVPATAVQTLAPVAQTAQKEKEESGKKLISLGDVFMLRRDLPDTEFQSKIVSFKGDSELYELRMLPAEGEDKQLTENFYKVYRKELAFYHKLSEMSEAKEGKYYYRPFIERSTLKDQIKRLGLDKKKSVEELSSNDLKFILQIFKEVRELQVSHAALDEENILVHEKRKWGLSKNMDVTFVGFTSADCSNDDMIEAAHLAFERVMGQKFYKEFREKFQL